MREARTDKVLVLGIDGLDPHMLRKFVDEGRMPNVEKLSKISANDKNYFMLGGVPTVTPPMWTSLGTGANPATHGITCFWNQDMKHLDRLTYALDSRKCKAEAMWNVTAEAGIPTLVWHWPGSSWPPTSDSEDLYVVDGSQPVAVNMGNGHVDWEMIVTATTEAVDESIKEHNEAGHGAGCIINNVEDLLEEADADGNDRSQDMLAGCDMSEIILYPEDGEIPNLAAQVPQESTVQIKAASGWNDAPQDALEFTFLTSQGLVRRPCLLLKNARGEYDTIQIFKSKKDNEPMFTVVNDGQLYKDYMDDIVRPDGTKFKTTRAIKILEMKPDGSYVQIVLTGAMDRDADAMWHPKTLYREIIENVDYVQAPSITTCVNTFRVENVAFPVWESHCQWQADAILYTIQAKGIKAVLDDIAAFRSVQAQYDDF